MRRLRKHWSFSAINQYLRCPLQYYFQRILRLPTPTVGSGLVLGGAVHEALAHYHTKLKQRRVASILQIQRVFAQAWKSREADQQIQYKRGETRVSQLAVGIGLLETYLKSPPPENILEIERELIVPLVNSQGEYLETPLVAIIDLITDTDDGLKIHELKTSGRSYGQFEVDTSLQASCYAHAAHTQFAVPVEVEFAVLVKTKTPKLQRISTVRFEEESPRLGDLVENVERAVANEIFYPIESPMNCSGCPFREPCRDWTPRPISPAPQPLELNGTVRC
jgi:putative RecB family exonuclease